MAKPDGEKDVSVVPDGPKLKALQKAKRITQERIAELSGMSKKVVWNALNGIPVKRSSLDCIAEALESETDEVISSDTDTVTFTQEMLEAIPLPVFFKDAEGVYRGCNERFCRFLDRERQHIIGKTVYEVAPNAHAKIYEARDNDLLAHPGEQVYQARVVAGAVERRVQFHKGTFPVDAKGKAEGIIGVIVDITDLTTFAPELLAGE